MKKWALEKLPLRSPLRKVLSQEADIVPAADLCVKISVWLVLASSEADSKQ